ncbi:19376_t:CDS:1, partial [Cetraspora pellucida]
KTHWNSWFNFIFWIDKHAFQLKDFYLNEDLVNNEGKAVQKLISTFKDPLLTFEFEILTMFVIFNAQE